MGIYNKFLRIVAPKLAVQRVLNQERFDTLSKGQRKHEGAGRGRRFSDNSLQSRSANEDIGVSLPMLRKRSRDAFNNNPYARRGVKGLANNIIGTGIMATPSGVPEIAVAEIKKLFKAWAESTACDFDGLQNFYGLQHLVMKTVAKSGECYVRRVWRRRDKKSKLIPLELQVLDPDFIDHGKSTLVDMDNGERIVNGVQFNKQGKRIAYWIFDRHPNETHAISRPVPIGDVLHIFEVEDPGQIHGLPSNSSIILRMQDFDEFEDAQLMKQKIAACFAGFVTSSDVASGLASDDVDTSDMTERFQPGTYQRLSPGEEITFSNPPSMEGSKDFIKQNLQGQAAGMGMSYEAYSGDLSGVNFSSGRMGWLEYQRGIEILQWNMIIPQFLNPVWEWVILAANVSGKIDLLDVPVIWTAPRREMIDPLKEIQALIKAVRAGFLSWQDAVRQLGYNPDEIIEQMAQDKKRFDKAGLMPESDPRYDADKMSAVEIPPDEK